MLVFTSFTYAGDIRKNTELARKYCHYVTDREYTSIAPHLLFPQFLNEETERNLGIQMGLELLRSCKEL